MLCENCQKNVATVHLTEIIQKEKKEIHLCSNCAKDKGVSLKPFFLLSDALDQIPPEVDQEDNEQLTCPDCGMTYSQFRSGGQLGCPRDYELFKPQLTPYLEKIHNSLFHCGKAPKNTKTQVRQAQEVVRLRRALTEAVTEENYEDAAAIRDQLKNLEKL